MAASSSDIAGVIRIAGFFIALLPAILVAPSAAGLPAPPPDRGVPGQGRLHVAAVSAPARAGTNLCVAVRRQVVSWSRRAGRGRDRAHVVGIRRPRVVVNRMRRSPPDGVLLRCVGRAKLSNGLAAPVTFGVKAVDGMWYLFLRRAAPS